MGIFSKIFAKKQEPEQEIIHLSQLEEWHKTKTKTKKQNLQKKLDQARQKIIQQTRETRKKIQKLSKAKLMNKQVPIKALHFLHGNKDTFIKKTTGFLDSLIFPEEIDELTGFFQDISQQIQSLSKGLARPTQILTEFHSNETREVTIALGEIEKQIQKLQDSMKKSKLQEIEQTRQKIQELQNKIKQEKELKQELSETIRITNNLKQENKDLLQEISLLEKDKEYKQLTQEKQQIHEKISKMQAQTKKSFSTIETAMKKYAHITFKHKEIINQYLESPINALTQDLHLAILPALEDMKKAILKNKIEMKPRKTKKTLEEIKKLNKQTLGSILTEYGQLHLEEKRIQEKISQLPAIQVKTAKQQKHQKNQEKINQKMSKTNQIQTELNKINRQQIIKELQNELNEKFHTNITISEQALAREETPAEQT